MSTELRTEILALVLILSNCTSFRNFLTLPGPQRGAHFLLDKMKSLTCKILPNLNLLVTLVLFTTASSLWKLEMVKFRVEGKERAPGQLLKASHSILGSALEQEDL